MKQKNTAMMKIILQKSTKAGNLVVGAFESTCSIVRLGLFLPEHKTFILLK